LRVAALGSGSRGNSILVECGQTRVLVDAGFSGAEIARRLEVLGVDPLTVQAVLVTHEHRDHTSGIGVAARRWNWPLYLTSATRRACGPLLRGSETIRLYEGERPFLVGELHVHPFSTCHDAADPVALTLMDPRSGLKVGVATDLGRATAPVRSALAGCHFLVLESNHDEIMLRESPYPWSVKQRIGGSRGHLSNRLAAELAVGLMHAELGGFLLAHLSDECNEPHSARRTVRTRLEECGFRGVVDVALQEEPSRMYDVATLANIARDGGPQLLLFGAGERSAMRGSGV
jgi:phosphoribosyl 1,2-cyclic phosphodiesterase